MNFSPGSPEFGPTTLPRCLKMLQDGPRGPQEAPRCLQDGSKMSLDVPKMSQDAPKIHPKYIQLVISYFSNS